MAKKISNKTIQVVTEDELTQVLSYRESVANLRKHLKAIEEQAESHEKLVLSKLQAGAKVDSAHLAAQILIEAGRCSPQWKAEYIGLAVKTGKEADVAEEEVKAKYPPKPVAKLSVTIKGL